MVYKHPDKINSALIHQRYFKISGHSKLSFFYIYITQLQDNEANVLSDIQTTPAKLPGN
jgi:hypothetical protein